MFGITACFFPLNSSELFKKLKSIFMLFHLKHDCTYYVTILFHKCYLFCIDHVTAMVRLERRLSGDYNKLAGYKHKPVY